MGLSDVGRLMVGRPPTWAARHPRRYVALDMLLMGLLVWLTVTAVYAVIGGPAPAVSATWVAVGGMIGRLGYHWLRRDRGQNRPVNPADGPDDPQGG